MSAASTRNFPDRRDRLFGRKPDLEYLVGRARYKGITFVVGRPQMGKTWLLTELARFLSTVYSPSYLVGFTESSGQTPDLLLRTVVDLYTRWLSNADYLKQARIVWEQQKSSLIENAGKAVGTIFEGLAKAKAPVGEAVGGLVSKAFEGLAAMNQKLLSGGVQIPLLQYEQARDLVNLVVEISGKSVALVFDQWEQSPQIEFEVTTLKTFLRHHEEDWKQCHIFVGLRPDEAAHQHAEDLAKGWRGTVAVYPLDLLRLEGQSERDSLCSFIRKKVAAAQGVKNDQELLSIVDGYPGTIYQWTSAYNAEKMGSRRDLESVADDAQAFRFREFDKILPKLSGKEKGLAVRLAVAPVGSPADWQTLKNEFLAGAPESVVDDLLARGALERDDPPSYGHPKRQDAAREWFLHERRHFTREQIERLVFELATRVKEAVPRFKTYVSSMTYLNGTAVLAGCSETTVALCQSSASLLGGSAPDSVLLMRARANTNTATQKCIAPLLSMGLFNALMDAKRDLHRRDALLEELRQLADTYPEDTAVCRRLAVGLFHTLIDAKQENNLPRRDALLEELRLVAGTHPQDAAMRKRLARGLFNTLIHSKQEGNLPGRESLLQELRQLARAYPQDAAVRQRLALGLFNTLSAAKQEKDLQRRDALLRELQELVRAYPGDPAVRECLAIALFNSFNAAKQENDPQCRDALLQELRQLATAYPQDAATRERLAKGLFISLNKAKQENDLQRRDALLEELQHLARAYPEDTAARERLAMGLFNTLYQAEQENDLARRDALLDELRRLVRAYPKDPVACEQLAKSLFISLNKAKQQNDLARRDALLNELRLLASAYPGDSPVRELFAKAMSQ